jgi:glycosyltransferase involved in cell wall biosynthesis
VTSPDAGPSVAVVIPCYNEAPTIAKVVGDFRRVLPDATIYVFDNNSSDATACLAAEAGAVVIREKRQGKGFVVAAMLTKLSADYFLMVDGDDTYPADAAPQLLAPVMRDEADMVVGQRLTSFEKDSFRPLHVFGNRLVRKIVNSIFSAGPPLHDIMSGYRAFTRDVAENLPIVASGFDVETEMTLQLLYRGFVIREVPVDYGVRPSGSVSKLHTFRDGARVLLKIITVFKAYKPLTFFGSLALVSWFIALAVGYFPIREYIIHDYVYSVPKAILASSLVLLGVILAGVGLLLHTVNFRILEMTNVLVKQLAHARRGDRGIGGVAADVRIAPRDHDLAPDAARRARHR